MTNSTTKLVMNETAQSILLSFHSKLPKKTKDLIRFYERGGEQPTYLCLGEDANFIAEEYYGTLATLKTIGKNRNLLDTVSVTQQKFESVIRDLLLVKRYRIELYTSIKGRIKNKWELSKYASPGNVRQFEDLLFNGEQSGETDSSLMGVSPIVMSIKLGRVQDKRLLGISFCDSTLHTIGISEIVDNDQFSVLESLCVQIGAKECLIYDNKKLSQEMEYDLKKINEILLKCNIVITEKSKKEFNTSVNDIEPDLKRLATKKTNLLPLLDQITALGSLQCLIKYLLLLNDETNFGTFRITTFDPMCYMRLDATAFEALNLFPSKKEQFQSQKSLSNSSNIIFNNSSLLNSTNLLGLLNRCKTKMGSRKLVLWIKQPVIDKKEIDRRHSIVEAFVEDAGMRCLFRDTHLRIMPDILRITKRIQRGSAKLIDVVRLYDVSKELVRMKETLLSFEGEQLELLNKAYISILDKFITPLSKFQKMIEMVVDLEKTQDHQYLINYQYEEELEELFYKREQVAQDIKDHAKKIKNSFKSLAADKVLFEKGKGTNYYFRITKVNQKHIKGDRKFIVLESRKNGVKFTTKKLTKLNQESVEIEEKYEKKQQEVVAQVVRVCKSYSTIFDIVCELISEIDVLSSFATTASDSILPYIRPTMLEMEKGTIILKESRHPCLEVQEDVNFIPNDLYADNNSSFLIITGPNCFGKSTYIKQIGMIILMAQIGSFVPCTEATISIRDCILARVGAGDRQLQGVSTFMAEMLEASSILKTATKNSLIIIDELGRGTSTADGFGLAWAISEYISTKIGSTTLFATHFHELTALESKIPSIKNLKVTSTISENTITPLYKVEPGSSDQSLGIRVAEIANFPNSVVDKAKKKHKELQLKKKESILIDNVPDFKEFSEMEIEEKKNDENEDTEIGKELILQFLEEFKTTQFDRLSPREAFDVIIKLKTNLLKEKNSYVKKILEDSEKMKN
ncbi:DNA mismatch repair protein msh2 [Anaeramoeba flamelloides]|uniref:DNA mismatch repair protein msh2 n=1 Tax=Anaeramoeba flamelloides TaxID=1746091 RepID=A0AAV8A784_9EUKA|nr:DNA mismatch repair protein msh2 [Anaeramoeba flamelloides]